MIDNVKKFFIVAGVIVILAIAGVWWSESNKPQYDNPNRDIPYKGNADAQIVVEEFSDFQCPSCASAQPTVGKLLADYGDRIKLEYHHFPLTQIHARAMAAAEAAECALDQGKFWEYHDVLFANQPNFSTGELKQYAADLGLNEADFAACLGSGAKQDIIQQDINEGVKRNLQGTPTFFINGEEVDNWGALDAEIKSRLGE